MTVVALQARVRSVELDLKEQRAALEKLDAAQGLLLTSVERLSEATPDTLDGQSAEAAEAAEVAEAAESGNTGATEVRAAEITRMQLELAAHDDRLEELEEAGGPPADEELLSLDGRIGAIEARLGDDASANELMRRLEAAEIGLADAQRALADAQVELQQRDRLVQSLVQRLDALEGAAGEGPGASQALPAAAAAEAHAQTQELDPGLESDASSAPDTVAPPADAPDTVPPAAAADGFVGDAVAIPLTDVKGIGKKLSQKLSAAGLDDARRLAQLDDDGLDRLAEASGLKRGRLVRLRNAARAL